MPTFSFGLPPAAPASAVSPSAAAAFSSAAPAESSAPALTTAASSPPSIDSTALALPSSSSSPASFTEASTAAAPSTATRTLAQLAASLTAGTWECPACEVRNKNDALICAACETPKPGAKADGAAAKEVSSYLHRQQIALGTRHADSARTAVVCVTQAPSGAITSAGFVFPGLTTVRSAAVAARATRPVGSRQFAHSALARVFSACRATAPRPRPSLQASHSAPLPAPSPLPSLSAPPTRPQHVRGMLYSHATNARCLQWG